MACWSLGEASRGDGAIFYYVPVEMEYFFEFPVIPQIAAEV
jgi:hypothetical protein